MIKVDISNVWGQLSLPDLLAVEQEVAEAHGMTYYNLAYGKDRIYGQMNVLVQFKNCQSFL